VWARDADNTFGIQRTDTSATVLAPTQFTHISTGIYELSFDEPAAGLTYRWYRELTYSGTVQRAEKFSYPPPTSSSYLTAAEGDELAATMFGLAAYKAETTYKQAALEQATARIDAAYRYQGRRYDPAQALEFPRIA